MNSKPSRVLFFGVDLKGNFSLVLDIIIYTISVYRLAIIKS